MINLLKKLFSKKTSPLSYIGKTEIKATIDPLIKKDSEQKKVVPTPKNEAAKVEKSPRPANKATSSSAKKPGRPKGQPAKNAANKNNNKS